MAGGAGVRMGRDKAEIMLGGRSLKSRSVGLMKGIFGQVIYAAGHRGAAIDDKEVLVVQDEAPELGPIGGLAAGLGAAANDRAFVVALDMPFINPKLVEFLEAYDREADVVVPIVKGRREPLHAFYNRSCLGAVRTRIDQGRRKIAELIETVKATEVEESKIRRIDPRLASFFNINTEEDLKKAKELLVWYNGAGRMGK